MVSRALAGMMHDFAVGSAIGPALGGFIIANAGFTAAGMVAATVVAFALTLALAAVSKISAGDSSVEVAEMVSHD